MGRKYWTAGVSTPGGIWMPIALMGPAQGAPPPPQVNMQVEITRIWMDVYTPATLPAPVILTLDVYLGKALNFGPGPAAETAYKMDAGDPAPQMAPVSGAGTGLPQGSETFNFSFHVWKGFLWELPPGRLLVSGLPSPTMGLITRLQGPGGLAFAWGVSWEESGGGGV